MFERHPDVEEFTRLEFVTYVRSKVGHDDQIISSMLDDILAAEIGEEVLHDLVIEAKTRYLAGEVAIKAMDVAEGKTKVDHLLTLVDEFDHLEDISKEVEFVTDDLEELYEHNVKQQGLRWRLRTLNEMLGSLRKGDFGFVFARPESGKTTFLASEISFFAEQVSTQNESGPIIWFNNEEMGEKVKLRLYQATLGVTLDELYSDRSRYQKIYNDITGCRIKLFDNANIHRRDVEALCESLKPSCVVFDQVDKIKGFDSDREDLRLGSIYIWAREIAKEYCPTIGVCQADATGENKKWLTMENVSNAKTAKQAEADWILGIGKVHDPGLEYIRYLHLSKNKLHGDVDTIPELRHGRRDVVIQPEIARYRDI